MPTPSTPAQTSAPAPGTPAAPAAAASATTGAESTPTADTNPAPQLDEAAVMAAFLGEPADTLQGDTQESDEQGEEGEPGETEAGTEPTGAPPAGQLDHLIDALRKDPDNDAILKRLRHLASEPAKLKSQIKELEDERKRTSLGELPPPDGELSPELQKMRANAQAWEDWCEEHSEGGEYEEGNEDTYLDAAVVKARLKQARAELRHVAVEEVMHQRELDATRATVMTKLQQSDPELFIKGSELNREFFAVRRRLNTRSPEFLEDAMALIEGRRARAEREAGVQKVSLKAPVKGQPVKGQPARGTPQSTATTKSTATRPAASGADLSALRSAARNGSPEANAALIDAFIG